MSDNKDSTGLLILGILLGVIIAFALLSKKTQSPTLSPAQSSPLQTTVQHQWQPMDIPRVDDIKPNVISQIDTSITKMTSQLEKAAYQLEQTTSKLQETVSKLQITQPQQITYQPIISQPITSQQTTYPLQNNKENNIQNSQENNQQNNNLQQASSTIYKNSEKWKINRGSDGRIKSLEIVRDVKKSV